jgi:hypothetical protein
MVAAMSTDALRATALELFDKYFAENYPGPHTIISDPHWHAPKIFRAVLSCLKEAPASETERAKEMVIAAARVMYHSTDANGRMVSDLVGNRGVLEAVRNLEKLEAALKADRDTIAARKTCQSTS